MPTGSEVVRCRGRPEVTDTQSERRFFSDDLEIQIGAFVANYNHLRYHEHQQSDPG
jgi:hypothetical protein